MATSGSSSSSGSQLPGGVLGPGPSADCDHGRGCVPGRHSSSSSRHGLRDRRVAVRTRAGGAELPGGAGAAATGDTWGATRGPIAGCRWRWICGGPGTGSGRGESKMPSVAAAAAARGAPLAAAATCRSSTSPASPVSPRGQQPPFETRVWTHRPSSCKYRPRLWLWRRLGAAGWAAAATDAAGGVPARPGTWPVVRRLHQGPRPGRLHAALPELRAVHVLPKPLQRRRPVHLRQRDGVRCPGEVLRHLWALRRHHLHSTARRRRWRRRRRRRGRLTAATTAAAATSASCRRQRVAAAAAAGRCPRLPAAAAALRRRQRHRRRWQLPAAVR